MSQWENGSIEEWPPTVAYPASPESFAPDLGLHVYSTKDGDWAMVVLGSDLESKFSCLFEQLQELKIEFHRIGLLRPNNENESVSDSKLEGLLQHCDLLAVPHTVAVEGQYLFSPGRIYFMDSAKDKKEAFNLFQLSPADEQMMTDGAPVHPVETEDLDAREKWFKDRH